jgi:Zn-dependent peptidase ImmA (M78 family)
LEKIDRDLAIRLAAVVGGTAAYWEARQRQYDVALTRLAESVPNADARAWLRSLPLKEMRDSGWLGDAMEPLHAAMSYFDVTTATEWRKLYTDFATRFSYRTSPSFDSKLGALAAWLRQGELAARHIECAPWSADKFRGALQEARGLTRLKEPKAFIVKLRKLCAQAGVAIVFLRAPPGCRASGATRFIRHDKAMTILSFRHLADDHFWFSFFHEAGHLLLHGQDVTFIDGDAAEETDREKEANEFAATALVPSSHQERLVQLQPRLKDVVRFAVSVGVAPGIVVGQLQHLRIIGRHQLNSLKRRYTWGQIQSAIS